MLLYLVSGDRSNYGVVSMGTSDDIVSIRDLVFSTRHRHSILASRIVEG